MKRTNWKKKFEVAQSLIEDALNREDVQQTRAMRAEIQVVELQNRLDNWRTLAGVLVFVVVGFVVAIAFSLVSS